MEKCSNGCKSTMVYVGERVGANKGKIVIFKKFACSECGEIQEMETDVISNSLNTDHIHCKDCHTLLEPVETKSCEVFDGIIRIAENYSCPKCNTRCRVYYSGLVNDIEIDWRL